MRRVKLVVAALAATALLVVGAAAADASGGRSVLAGSAPSWANKGNFVGAADPNSPVGFRVYLGWRNQAGAEAVAKAVSDPKSPSYGKALSPSAFRQQFAPTQAQVGAVRSWLQSQGFRLDYTPQNNHYVAAEGTVAQAQAAFGTAFGTYKVQGKTVRSPSGDVSVPDSLAGTVSGVVGLDESALFTHPDHVVDTNAPAPAGFRNSPPLSAYFAQLVTNSYGFSTELLPPGYVKPLEDTLIQAAAEGIGVYFSSGDNGDETSAHGFATPDWPAVSPWVTAVGGTSLGVSPANTPVLETGWGTNNYSCNTTTLACTRTGWLYGSGGGVSQIFPKPSYQSGLNVSGRAIPDVAALGDPQTGLLVGETQTFPDGTYYDEYRIGGTSPSRPDFP